MQIAETDFQCMGTRQWRWIVFKRAQAMEYSEKISINLHAPRESVNKGEEEADRARPIWKDHFACVHFSVGEHRKFVFSKFETQMFWPLGLEDSYSDLMIYHDCSDLEFKSDNPFHLSSSSHFIVERVLRRSKKINKNKLKSYCCHSLCHVALVLINQKA